MEKYRSLGYDADTGNDNIWPILGSDTSLLEGELGFTVLSIKRWWSHSIHRQPRTLAALFGHDRIGSSQCNSLRQET